MALVNPFLPPTQTCLPPRRVSPAPPSNQVLLWTLSPQSQFKPPLSSSRRKHARCGATADIKTAPLLDGEGDHKVLVSPSTEEERIGERVVADYDWTQEWYPLYLTKNVPDDAPLGLKVFDKDVVLFKDGFGQFNCYEDRCPHRLAKLSEGQLIDGRIECLYHGWQFEGEGKCVKIPQLPADAKIPRSALV